MAIIPPGFAQYIMPITRAGDPDAYAVTWANDVDLSAAPTLQEYVNEIQADFVTKWTSSFPNDCTIGPVTMRFGQDGGDPLVLIASTTGTGTNNTDFLPQNAALLVQKRSLLGGRRNRGRLFMPVLTEGAVNEVGQLSPTQLTSYQNVANSWLSSYNNEIGAFGDMVILHSSGDSTPTPVTSLVVQGTIATQRRRLRR